MKTEQQIKHEYESLSIKMAAFGDIEDKITGEWLELRNLIYSLAWVLGLSDESPSERLDKEVGNHNKGEK